MSIIYIADCAENGGVYVYNLEGNKLSQQQFIQLSKPMYLCKEKSRLFCILRAPFDDNTSGILSFDIDNNGLLCNHSDILSTEGVVSCHLCVENGMVFNANYLSGSVNKLGIKTVTHNGKGTHPTRQESPHTHFTRVSPDGKYILVCDLGLDTIFTYDKDLNEISKVKVPDGNGVRHLEYSEDKKTIYSADELSNTISVFDYDDGVLKYLTSVNGLPENFVGENTAAAIKRHGKLLYISHRGYDGISVFDISNKTPKFVTSFKAFGNSPRDFEIVDDYIIVANEGGNVTVIDKQNYNLKYEIKLSSPLCVIKGD